jgi:hypothetical protein
MKKLVALIGFVVMLGCIVNVHAFPRKTAVGGRLSTSTNTYQPGYFDSNGNQLVITSGVTSSSSTADVTIYHGESLPAGTNNIGDVDVLSITASSSTNKTTVYDDGTSLTTADERYESKISSCTANKITSTGNISPTFEVINWSFLSKGGDTTITGSNINGTIYALQDISVNGEFIDPIDSPTFVATLPASTTLYYIITGVE